MMPLKNKLNTETIQNRKQNTGKDMPNQPFISMSGLNGLKMKYSTTMVMECQAENY